MSAEVMVSIVCVCGHLFQANEKLNPAAKRLFIQSVLEHHPRQIEIVVGLKFCCVWYLKFEVPENKSLHGSILLTAGCSHHLQSPAAPLQGVETCHFSWTYPLVNIQKTMEITCFVFGQSTISMAIFNSKLLNYQKVSSLNLCAWFLVVLYPWLKWTDGSWLQHSFLGLIFRWRVQLTTSIPNEHDKGGFLK